MSGKHAGLDLHKHPNLDNPQHLILIWLDSNVKSPSHQNTIYLFRSVVENFQPFTDDKQCIRFIENTADTEKICMVVSGSFGEQVVPRVHELSQINSIIVFCGNKQRHEQWARMWPKVRGVMTDPGSIAKYLIVIAHQLEQSAAPSSAAPIKYDKKFDQLDPSFMYTQLLKEILLTIHFNRKHTREFIDYCRQKFADNAHELDNIQRFEEEYDDHPPVWWYTCDCFLSRVINDALQNMEIDALIRAGFFIAALHRQIEQLHAKQFMKHRSKHPLEVYRGQAMSRADVEKLKRKRGGLLAFSQFLTTDRDHQASLKFAYAAAERAGSLAVLFVIRVEPSRQTVPFALVAELDYYSECNEVLFSTHAVFRIHDIQPMNHGDRAFQVTMALTNDTDDDLRKQTDRLRDELSGYSNEQQKLTKLLSKMGHSSQAEALPKTRTEETMDDTEESSRYEQLAAAKFEAGDFKSALKLYEEALKVNEQTDPSDRAKLARSYSNIGHVYQRMGNCKKALASYEKALGIRQKSLPPDDLDLASSYSDIGDIYQSLDDQEKALSFHEKALAIQGKSLKPDHPIVQKCRKKIDDIKRM